MKRLLLALIVFVLASTAHAESARFKFVSASAPSIGQYTDIDGDALSGGVTSRAISMTPPREWGSSAMAWHLAVTPGTTTTVTISCEESPDSTTWFTLPFCSPEPTSTCAQLKLEFPVAPAGINNWSFAVRPRAQYVRCKFEDEAAGDGTIVVTGTRFAQ